MMEHSVTIYLVDDEPSVTDSLTWMLRSVGIEALTYNSPIEFLKDLQNDRGPCCMVLDLRMPGMSGLEVMENVTKRRPDVPITFLSAHGDIPTAVRSVKLGAHDFLQKPFEPQLFIDTVNHMTRLALHRFKEIELKKVREERLKCLSARETELLEYLLTGSTSKDIARLYNISPKTVDVHRANIMRKLNISTYSELIRQFR